MSIKKVIEFTDFNWFYAKYKPLTPYGIDHKEKHHFINDRDELNKIYFLTDSMIDFIGNDDNSVIKIEHHLSRIDRLNSLDKETFDSADIFLIKKFLIHFKAIAKQIDNKWHKLLQLDFSSSPLLDVLTPDNDFSESFYLSSAFSIELCAIRKQINNLNAQLSNIKQKKIDQLKIKYQLDFNEREFILVDNIKINDLHSSDLIKEFYDSNLLCVKPVFPDEYMNGLIQKEALFNLEAEAEKQTLLQLSKEITNEKQNIERYITTIQQLDVLIAKARLAIRFKLEKPVFTNSTIRVEQGIFLPLKSKQDNTGLKYKPLTVSFDSNSILLSGSNMGGKTILFKTIGFLQLLSQMGFFAPAKRFETQVYNEIHVLGIVHMQNIEGLSSFGQEIHNLSTVISRTHPMLLLVDELAKTTNATEAKAILYAVLKYVANHKNITGLFSTHFINIPKIDGVSKFRMKGLNKEEYLNYCQQNTEHDIKDKIKLINAYMQYEVEKDNSKSNQFDALTIAGLLGLDNEILKHANDYLQTKYD